MGTWGNNCFSSLAAVKPPIIGMFISSRMRSGLSAIALVIAS